MIRFLTMALLLAAVLSGAPVGVPPAQAQTLHFGLGIGSSEDKYAPGTFNGRQLCILGRSGLRHAIEDAGYSDVTLSAMTGRYVRARATRGDWVYRLKINSCTGDIVGRDRLRAAD